MAVNDDMEKNLNLSIGAIYNKILKEREEEKEKKKEEKQLAKEAESESTDSDSDKEDRPLSKKEKKRKSLEQWRDVIVNLTGDDLEYVSTKKKKSKYSKWISDDDDIVGITKDKPKKKKKTNYKKEFEHELNMLKNIVNEQGQWTTNLYKRFQNAAGPIAKDGVPLNKTQVELAAAINTSRMNQVSIIKAITDIRKTVADLEMKRKKADGEGSSSEFGSDIGLQGADIIQRIAMGDTRGTINNNITIPVAAGNTVVGNSDTNNNNVQQPVIPQPQQFETFDPDTWGGTTVDNFIKYENTPKKTMVEYSQSANTFRYKTIDTTTGKEIEDYPNPEYKIKGKDFESKCVRDEYNNVYDLDIVD